MSKFVSFFRECTHREAAIVRCAIQREKNAARSMPDGAILKWITCL